MRIKVYEVGGAVRDELLGLKTKDVDYTVEAESYDAMRFWLEQAGFEIFVESPDFFTIRARFPRGETYFGGRKVAGLTGDFVLARKEGQYTDGRRPDVVEMGTLMDDLARRDFTINSMARGADGVIIDPFGGQADLAARVLRCVGSAEDRMREDALRALRAVRFAVTKGFTMDGSLWLVLCSTWLPALLANVAVERRYEELVRAFQYDTLATLDLLEALGFSFRDAVFSGGLRLAPTLKS